MSSENNIKKMLDEKFKSLDDIKKSELILKIVYEIVNKYYGSKIQNFTIKEPSNIGFVVSGFFETPRLGGKNLLMSFDIDEKRIILGPKNPEVLNNNEAEISYFLGLNLVRSFAEEVNYFSVEYFDFAQKPMNCVKGWSCRGENGFACLSHMKKNCANNLLAEHKTYVGWLKDQKSKGVKLHWKHERSGEVYGFDGFDKNSQYFGLGTSAGIWRDTTINSKTKGNRMEREIFGNVSGQKTRDEQGRYYEDNGIDGGKIHVKKKDGTYLKSDYK